MKALLWIFLILFSICDIPGKCQSIDFGRVPERKSAYFAVHIAGNHPLREKLKVFFWPNDLLDSVQYFRIERDSINSYYFTLSPFEFPSRIKLFNRGLHPGKSLIGRQLVLPGDSVHMWFQKNGDGGYDIDFTGRGAGKYRCVNALMPLKQRVDEIWRKVEMDTRSELKTWSPREILDVTEALFEEYCQILESHRDRLSPGIYDVLRADLIGYFRHKQMKLLAAIYTEVDRDIKPAYGAVLKRLLFDDNGVNDTTVLAHSTDYRDYIYERYKLRFLFLRKRDFSKFDMTSTSSFSCRELYDRLKYDFRGTLREKLMAQFFLYSRDLTLFFDETDEDALVYCLEDALGLVRTPFLKRIIARKLNNNTQGKTAYDFALPDSTGKIVRLSDFKGKVVFMDIWGYPCGGCLSFKRRFEEEVYPKIKDHPEFVVISVNLSDKKAVWLNALDQYSTPGFINLAAGLGERNRLREYYNIGAIPFLILIDRQGKIVTTTSRDTDDLLVLIEQTLQKRKD